MTQGLLGGMQDYLLQILRSSLRFPRHIDRGDRAVPYGSRASRDEFQIIRIANEIILTTRNLKASGTLRRAVDPGVR